MGEDGKIGVTHQELNIGLASYMIAPEESIGLEKWMEQLGAAIQEYARAHHLPVRPLEEIRLED